MWKKIAIIQSVGYVLAIAMSPITIYIFEREFPGGERTWMTFPIVSFIVWGLFIGKHPIKYTKNNGCNSFVRVCSHCCYNSVNHCYFSICVVRVATVHHMMHSAYMASLQ